jgi:hypothetical protein
MLAIHILQTAVGQGNRKEAFTQSGRKHFNVYQTEMHPSKEMDETMCLDDKRPLVTFFSLRYLSFKQFFGLPFSQ